MGVQRGRGGGADGPTLRRQRQRQRQQLRRCQLMGRGAAWRCEGSGGNGGGACGGSGWGEVRRRGQRSAAGIRRHQHHTCVCQSVACYTSEACVPTRTTSALPSWLLGRQLATEKL